MIIKSAEFLISSKELKKCPEPKMPEYAFTGRSNVGKSSLINMLVNKKGLAKTSATPGKTQLINHFIINEDWYLVDLPGLGYAKTAKTNREAWEKMIYNYLQKRKNLVNTFILVDGRHTDLKTDLELVNWFGKNQIPFTIVLTKIDKLSKLQMQENISLLEKTLLTNWEELPQIICSSATAKTGRDEILDIIEENNSLYYKQVKQ